MSNYVGEFKPKQMLWEFSVDDTPLFDYGLDDVIDAIIEYFAIKHKKISGDLSKCPPAEQENILDWFADDVFVKEEFGNQIIVWMKNSLDDVETDKDLEYLFKGLEGEEVTIDDMRITIQEAVEEESEQGTKDKLEDAFLKKDKEGAKAILDGILKKESWVSNFLKEAGVSLDLHDKKLSSLATSAYWVGLHKREV